MMAGEPITSRSRVSPLTGDREFESISLQRGVSCELDFLDQARRLYTLEPRLLLLPRRLRIGGFGTCEMTPQVAQARGTCSAGRNGSWAGIRGLLRDKPRPSRAFRRGKAGEPKRGSRTAAV